MGQYAILGNKHDEVPFIMIDNDTYDLTDAEILADMADKGVGAPPGTIIAKAGLGKMKQLSFDETFVEVE